MLKLLKIRNVRLLFAAQALGMAVPPFQTLLGGIVGARLAPDPSLSTLPVAMMIVGLALGILPVTLYMRRAGRRRGFMLGCVVSIGGALLAAIAIQQQLFWLFCLAGLLLGFNGASIQQYRFAVTENVTADDVPDAISLVLLGTLLAALLGPYLAQAAGPAQGLQRDAVAYLMIATTLAVAMLWLSRYRDVMPDETRHDGPARPLQQVLSQPDFLLAVAAAAIAYGVMTFLMTATPVSMHVLDGHSLESAARVIQSHIAAMFLPSLVSAWLVHRLGLLRMMGVGVVLLFACLWMAARGHEVMHYWVSLVLLGVGWNFLFVGATTLLTRTYRASERFRVQAVNDLFVFSITATASTASGAAVHALGWSGLLAIALPAVAVLAVLLLVLGLATPRAS